MKPAHQGRPYDCLCHWAHRASSWVGVSCNALVFSKEGNGFPEGGEEFLAVADEDGVGAHGGEKALRAGIEGVVELDATVLVLTVVDEPENLVEGGAKHVDLIEGLQGRGVLEVAPLLLGVVPGVETMLEGVLVSFGSGHGKHTEQMF